MSNNNLFKTLLVFQTLGLLAYTYVAYKAEGINLFSVFIKNVTALNWSGQFNLDFLCYLFLSGLWIMWRNKFNVKSIFIGTVAMILGIVFFAPYLFWLITKENGNLNRVFCGDR
jgi:hypothetical protein